MTLVWQRIKEFIKWGGRKLGIIKHLNSITDHRNVTINETTYDAIVQNKELYQGHYHPWHDLRYNVRGRTIERKQMSMQMPKVLAKKLARLVFNEGVKLSVAEDKQNQWDLVKDLFESNKFIREFQRYLEYMFAMGGLALEVYVDGYEPKIAYATADAFFPIESDSENIDEAVIANTFVKNGRYYTLLKWHEWSKGGYTIKNELYESLSGETLGDKVELSKLFPDMEPITSFSRLDSPLFVYLKPNEANNVDITSPLGISVFENAKDTLRMLDIMYDFWYNEFRLGKRKVAVPQYMLEAGTNVYGEPYLYLDDSEELFVALNGGEMDDFQVKDLTVDIRDDQVINSIQSLLDILAMQCGLSIGTFSFSKAGIKTATQVVSENSETYQTRSSHISVIEDALRDLVVTTFNVVKEIQGLNLEPLEREDISIDFNDGVFIDQESKANYYIKLYNSGAISQKEMIKNINGFSEEEAQDMLAEINSDDITRKMNSEVAVSQAELRIER